MEYKVLIVDDEIDNLDSTIDIIKTKGFRIDTSKSGEDAIVRIKNPANEYAVVILDYKMPGGMNGAETAREILRIDPSIKILMYSADKTRDALKESFQCKIVEFIDKDMDSKTLCKKVGDAYTQYEEDNKTIFIPLEPSLAEQKIKAIGLIGCSDSFAGVAKKVLKYRDIRDNVLITGESGVGKEEVAKALHVGSPEKLKFVNCGLYIKNSQLMESDLCGHVKGSFTSADKTKQGILESAAGGTVVFDELHNLDLDAQVKLLRIFNDKKVRPVGSNSEMSLDFRLIALTQPKIEDLVKTGLFLSDLLYRIDVQRIDIPPLRERLDDIEPLVLGAIESFYIQTGIRKKFLASTIRHLRAYSWPGNVRQLNSVVQKLLINTPGNKIKPSDLDEKLCQTQEFESANHFQRKVEKEERRFIYSLLVNARHNKSEAAKLGGFAFTTFLRKLEKYGLN